MESTSSEGSPTYFSKGSDNHCFICKENIEVYAIGECEDNQICWKCALTHRLKQRKEECLYCKSFIHKLLITKNKEDFCLTSINDPETDLWF